MRVFHRRQKNLGNLIGRGPDVRARWIDRQLDQPPVKHDPELKLGGIGQLLEFLFELTNCGHIHLLCK